MTRSRIFPVVMCGLVAGLCMVQAGGVYAQNASKEDKKKEAQERRAPMVEKTFPLNVSWTLVRLNKRVYQGERPTMILDGQSRMQGFSGCNTYSATSYVLRPQRIVVGPINFTKRSCSQTVLNAEKAFLVALRGAFRWDMKGSVLTIFSSEGELQFERTL